MTPEHIVIQMTDGTEFAALVHMESGKLHVKAVGFLGFTFVLEPTSLRQVCNRLLEMILDDQDQRKGFTK
jgi:hypothetical protein